MGLIPLSGHLYQHQDGVYKPNTAQTNAIKLLIKFHKYEALHQRTNTVEIITGEKKCDKCYIGETSRPLEVSFK
jgi:hypothetical protein